jgi:uncharacterized glyoxalase superfamily protein PhnB
MLAPAKEPEMELVQTRIVTDDVQRLAAFYARLAHAAVVLNDYYVEVPTGAMSVGFSRRRFTEYREDQTIRPGRLQHRAEIILDFRAGDVDAEYQRIASLGADWVMPPTTQPWGNRSMIFKDPEGNLVNVFSPARPRPASPRPCPRGVRPTGYVSLAGRLR